MQVIRDIPFPLFLATVAIPLAMVVIALVVGFYARQGAAERRAMSSSPNRPVEDTLQAAITLAIVPLAFAALIVWARFH